MFPLIRHSLFVVVIAFAAALGGLLVWWERNNSMLGGEEVLLGLLVLPVVIFAGVIVCRRVMDALRVGRRYAEQDLAAPVENVGQDLQEGKEFSTDYAICIAESSLITAAGSESSLIWTFLSESHSKQELDSDLVEKEGISVFVAKVPALDVAPAEQLVSVSVDSTAFPIFWDRAELRTLQLLMEVWDELLPLCTERIRASLERNLIKDDKSHLPVVMFVPLHWTQAQREWLVEHIDCIASSTDDKDIEISVSVVSAEGSAEILKAIDEMRWRFGSRGAGNFALVLAAESLIDPDGLALWHSEGKVLGSGRKGDIVPGEGAAGLLLELCVPATDSASGNEVQIQRLAVERRENTANMPGSKDAEILTKVVAEALAIAGTKSSDVVAIVSDADRRVSRLAEVMRVANAVFPHIELPEGAVASGMASGFMNATHGLISLALAHARVKMDQKPVVVLCVNDAHERCAVVINHSSTSSQWPA